MGEREQGGREQAAVSGLRVPQRCVRASSFRVTVTGRPIQSVTFFANGRGIRTLQARPGQERFTVHARMTRAAMRMVARVRFAPNATQRTKTMSAVVRRCPQGQLAPTFTG